MKTPGMKMPGVFCKKIAENHNGYIISGGKPDADSNVFFKIPDERWDHTWLRIIDQ
jgi:hypothetical protein